MSFDDPVSGGSESNGERHEDAAAEADRGAEAAAPQREPHAPTQQTAEHDASELRRVLDEAAAEASAQDRAQALGAEEERLGFPRPLPAGPQAYLDPEIWRPDDRDAYETLLRLMAAHEVPRARR